jgi:hypothetical protein
LNCNFKDFDPFIKFGRDNLLFVKREYLDHFKENTRYSEDEIKNLKTLYCQYAEIGKGLNYGRFTKLMSSVFNIENHPFFPDMFITLDKN